MLFVQQMENRLDLYIYIYKYSRYIYTSAYIHTVRADTGEIVGKLMCYTTMTLFFLGAMFVINIKM